MKPILICLVAISIIGCSSGNFFAKKPTVRPVEVKTVYIPVEILHPPLPEPVTWLSFEWTVLTPEIMRTMIKAYELGDLPENNIIFFGIRPLGYQNLAVNMAELKRYLEGQKSVIKYYRTTVPKEVFLPKKVTE